MNCGDWVESCTAIVEHFDGAFEIVKWTSQDPALDRVEMAGVLSPAEMRSLQLDSIEVTSEAAEPC
jgi:hypothetical protein